MGLVGSGVPETGGGIERVDGENDDYDGIRLRLIEARRRAPSALVLPGVHLSRVNLVPATPSHPNFTYNEGQQRPTDICKHELGITMNITSGSISKEVFSMNLQAWRLE